jgi:curli biogenesis system outer membrane secretion channel CsgG
MARIFYCVFALLIVLASDAAAQQKKRVAVLSFDDAAVSSSAASALGTSQDVGAGLADVLIRELVKGGAYSLVERTALDAVLKEQNFSNSSRADPKTAAAIGRLLGVDAIIIGSVTQFGVQESAVSVPTGPLSRLPGGLIRAAGKRVNAKGTVAITARIVDVNTGEILTAVTGTGESSQSSVAVGGYSTGALDMTSSSFQQTMLGEAVNGAAQSVAANLTEFGKKLAAAPVDYSGLIADVSGNTLILNVGRARGVRVGDTVEITRAGRTITDPQTKRVLRTVMDKVGAARVTEVDDVSATATIVDKADVRVGDQVRRAQ